MLLNLRIILSSNSFFILPIIPIFILFYSHLFSPWVNNQAVYLHNTHSITLYSLTNLKNKLLVMF